MPIFQYEALNAQGKVVKDEIDARDEDDATSKLHGLKLYPTRIKAKAVKRAGGQTAGGRPKGRSMVFGGVSGKQLTTFTRQLSTLTDAGIPIVQSLRILESQLKPGGLKSVIGNVADDIEGGSSLSEAMAKYPRAFDRLFVNMIRAGEAGGILESILQRLAELREKSARLKRRVIGAMIYPAAVITIASLILVGIMIFIVPKFEKMFAELDVILPPPTVLLITTARALANRWYLVPLVPVGIYVLLKLITASKTGRYWVDWIKIRSHDNPLPALVIFLVLPGILMIFISRIIQKAAIARFARTFGTLIQSGVPILEALNIVKETTGNAVLATAIEKVHDNVREGESIAGPIREAKVADEMVVNMIQVGEETGNIEMMLMKIADAYDEEVDTAVEGLTSIIEPMMIVFLGICVGFIVISLFLPLIELMNSLGQ